MTPARWEQVEQLYHAALERAPEQRAAFLDEACNGDHSMRQEVESLLAYDEPAQRFIATPPDAIAAELLAADQAPSLIDSSLNHYQILSRLGRGGMGDVYLATDTRLGRKVAVKLLPAEFTRDAERMRRFEQEARAASALNHPNIITIHEIGQVDQHHFIVSEFVEGETVRQRIKSGPLELKAALEIAMQVASALQAAHRAGIVHRDIKPENVMLRPDGLVKVLDFGLAKLTGPQTPTTDSQASTSDRLSTESGVVMGTVHYMSPEQARGLKVDHRTDIFSLGVMLYEMLAGRRPFEGATTSDVIVALLTAEPSPLRQHWAVAPAELEQVVSKCLAKEREARYQSAADLKVALEDLRAETTAGRRIPAPMRRRWTWAALPALLALLLVVGFFAWRMWRPGATLEPLQATALTTLPGREQFPSLSPDGNHVVFDWTDARQGNQDIYVQLIGQDSRVRLTSDPRSDYNPVWSPDGKWIAFFRSEPPAPTGLRGRELLLIAPLGGPERKLADIRSQDFFPAASFLAWSADSQSLVVTDATGEGKPDALFVVSLATGEKRQLTNPQPPALADIAPAVSPDGRSLVFLRRTTFGAGELHLLPLGTDLTAAGEPKRLTSVALRADFPAWMPDGREIVFSAKGGLWRLAVAGENTPTRIPYVGEDGAMPTILQAQSGKPTRLVYVRSFVDSNIWRVETSAPGAPATSAPVTAISSTKYEYHCAFSPDGHRVAFTSTRSGEAEIWVADADGANALQLTSTQAQDTNCAAWSPDGQSIAFSSNGEGEFDVYMVPAAGGRPRRLTSHPAIDLCPRFSRDGQWLYFTSMRSGDYRVWKMPAAGGEAVQVTPNQGGIAVESADSGSLYYNMVAVVSPLWRLPLAGGEPVKVFDGIVWFNWCLFGNGVYLIDRPGSETRLQYFNFGTGKSATVARNLGEVTAGLTVSPDGRTILFTRVDSYADDLMLVENFR